MYYSKEAFEKLYIEFSARFGTEKYLVYWRYLSGWLKITVCCLKGSPEIDARDSLEVLNCLQEQNGLTEAWLPFYFSYKIKKNNSLTYYQFRSDNDAEKGLSDNLRNYQIIWITPIKSLMSIFIGRTSRVARSPTTWLK